MKKVMPMVEKDRRIRVAQDMVPLPSVIPVSKMLVHKTLGIVSANNVVTIVGSHLSCGRIRTLSLESSTWRTYWGTVLSQPPELALNFLVPAEDYRPITPKCFRRPQFLPRTSYGAAILFICPSRLSSLPPRTRSIKTTSSLRLKTTDP